MNKILYVVILSICLLSCRGLRYTRENLGCFTGEKTDITSLININGYFVTKFSVTSGSPPKQRYSSAYTMFFENGMFLGNFSPSSMNEPWFYRAFNWGHFTISGDTIKTRWTSRPPRVAGTFLAFEVWYVVIDKNTIQPIFSKPLFRTTPQEMARFLENHAHRERPVARFVPADNLPNPDNAWLKQQRWFWCNKDDWREFMERRR